MKRYLKLYFQFFKQYIKILVEYRADFIVGLVGFLLVQFVGVIFVRLIFNTIPALQGWSFYQVIFIYGLAQIPRGIDHVFTDNLWILAGSIIVEGNFDRYLIKPINPLFQLIAEKFQPDGLGEIAIGTMLFITAAVNLDLSFTPVKILLLLLVILSATIIYTSIKLTVASIAFWVKFAQAHLFMVYQLSDFTKYPIGIYPKGIRFLLTFIVPFTFTAYFPGAYFLGKEGFLEGILMTILISIIASCLSYFVWTRGLKRYESSGN